MKRYTASTIISLSAIAAISAAWPFGLGAGPVNPPPITAASSCCVAVNPSVAEHRSITLEGAHQVLVAATAKAKERNAGGAIAIVDDAGHLVAFRRLDGTFAAGASVSIGKARTAALFRKPTKVFEDSLNGGRIALAAVDELTPLQGGVPITQDGFIVGAIGVSGAHSQVEDEEIALAGAAALAIHPTASK